MNTNSFVKFIKEIADENTPLGDLAKDILRDKDFPMGKTEQEMISYLEFKTRSVSDVFKVLMREYKRAS